MKKFSYTSGGGGNLSLAFTLAEVLITLGIIGVVAAITIPSLINEHQKAQTIVQLKKVYSDLNNAVKLSEVANGAMSDWDIPSCASSDYQCFLPFLEQYWLPYFQGANIAQNIELNKNGYFMLSKTSEHSIITHYIALNNGTILSFAPNTAIEHAYIWLFADINGMKGPNKVGRDIFVFDVYNYLGTYNVKLWGAGTRTGDYYDIEALMNSGTYACNSASTGVFSKFNCGRVIELNGWKIPAGYPW